MNSSLKEALEALCHEFAGTDFAPAPLLQMNDPNSAQLCICVAPELLIAVMRFLKTDHRCAFEQLTDLTCVDYLNFPDAHDRFGVTYALLSLSREHRLWVKCFVNDPNPEVPTVTGVWRGAEWLEREVWDLFGVRFAGHPDLRRIMTWEGFKAHPLRKDYPVTGQGEREDFETVTTQSA